MTRRQEGLTFSSPGPSLHITAAATALTTFINVSRQPESRKRRHKEFLQKVHAPQKPCENGQFVIAARAKRASGFARRHPEAKNPPSNMSRLRPTSSFIFPFFCMFSLGVLFSCVVFSYVLIGLSFLVLSFLAK